GGTAAPALLPRDREDHTRRCLHPLTLPRRVRGHGGDAAGGRPSPGRRRGVTRSAPPTPAVQGVVAASAATTCSATRRGGSVATSTRRSATCRNQGARRWYCSVSICARSRR